MQQLAESEPSMQDVSQAFRMATDKMHTFWMP